MIHYTRHLIEEVSGMQWVIIAVLELFEIKNKKDGAKAKSSAPDQSKFVKPVLAGNTGFPNGACCCRRWQDILY